MKWKIKFTSRAGVRYFADGKGVRAENENAAIEAAKADITATYESLGFTAKNENGGLAVTDASGSSVDMLTRFTAIRVYDLLNEKRESYESETPGTLGGHKRLKIYGRLDCPAAAMHIAKGEYVKFRVFFPDEQTAVAAGFRPCGICMKEQYKKWKAKNNI